MQAIYEKQLNQGLIYSHLIKYKDRLKKTKDNIAEMLTSCKNPLISMSWGKDSLVMGDIILSIKDDIDVVHWQSSQSRYIANFDTVSDAFFKKHRKAKYILNEFDLKSKLKNEGKQWAFENSYDGVFIGLCKDESRARRMSLAKGDKNILTYKIGIKRFCPMADWKILDLQAYIATEKLKVLNLYENYGLTIRTTSRIKNDGYSTRGLDHLNSTQQSEVTRLW
jgi:3'-phosphoadenosine 5'-phosphosulfate sulfotransferase (PAPS reductase)/FAD synthetase